MPVSERYIEAYDELDTEEVYNLSDEEIFEIQERYRKKRLIESLIGPIISTAFHIALVIILAIFITDTHHEISAEIEVKIQEIEEIVIEEPPPIEEPIEEIKESDINNPTLTTVALDNVETNDQALEDTSDEAPSTDDNMAENAVSDVVVSPSAFASPSVYGGRSASGRASAVSKFGGNKVGQDALLRALWWLAEVQNPDGSWGTNAHDAFTGLALLTFLAHGETQTSKHFGKTVKKAMQWMVNAPVLPNIFNSYSHAIKTYAISEAYAMTGVPTLESKMNECVKILIDGQQEGGCFDYGYSKDEGRQDLSLAGWNYQALKAAYGAGCEVPGLDEAIKKGIKWLKKAGDLPNGFPYEMIKNPNGLGSHTMRAVGTLCLQLYGEGKTAEIQDDLKMIATTDLKNYNWNEPPVSSLYGWYYATQAMFQKGGPMWKKWNRKFQKVLTENQHSDGYWNYPGKSHAGALLDDLTTKIYATTLCALQLTVYYRYLPSSMRTEKEDPEKLDAKEKEANENMVEEDEGIDLIE